MTIVFADVTKRFDTGTVAVEHADLRIEQGEFVAIVGPSGCGKSTLLRMAAGLDQPSSGTVSLGTSSIGFIFQEPTLLPWRTVRANVELCAELGGVDREQTKRMAAETISAVGLDQFADQLPRTLSGGMKMRASMARALTLAPDVLLLDEPFGALDEMTRETMQTELARICAETGAAVVFVTHSIPEAVFLSDRVVVMSPRPGRIREILTMDLRGERTEELREDEAFFERVSAVREALHGSPSAGAKGVENR